MPDPREWLAVLFWPRRRRRWLALLTLLALAVCAWPRLAAPWLFPQYRYMHDRFTGVLVEDVHGRFLGLFPGPMDPVGDFAPRLPSPDHKALLIAPDDIPEGWWRVLTALEDRHLGSWRSWGGIDVVALGKAVLWDLPRGRFRGASTLPMMLVRSMHHAAADPDEGWAGKLRRKTLEWLHAPVLMQELGGGDRAALKQWLAMHVALIQGAPGSRLGAPVYGLEASARLLFGVPAQELDLAQQALLAAAFYRPILIGPQPDATQAAYWRRIRTRAARGLRLAYGDQAAAAIRRVLAMPVPRPRLAPALARQLPDDPVRRFRVVANPAARARYFAGPALVQASAELQDRYGYTWRRDVAAVRLTLDAAANRAFRDSLERVLGRMQKRLGDELALALDGEAQVVVAVADRDGALVRFHASGEDSVYAGIRARRDAAGRYDPARETRSIGSLGKLPLALYLATAGSGPDERWCNRALAGGGHPLHNPGGDAGVARCTAPGAWYRARQVYARSLNLPLLWRLRDEPDAALAPYLEAFGLTRHDATPLRTGLTLGIVAAAPRTLHRMLHLSAAALRGEASAAPTVRVIDMVAERRGDAVVPTARGRHTALPAVLRNIAASPARRRAATALLAAPLVPGGTAQRLADWRAGTHAGVTFHIAKTGTTQARGHATRDAYLGGALVLHGEAYSYLALIGTGHPGRPLGRDIGGGSGAPLVRAALASLASQ